MDQNNENNKGTDLSGMLNDSGTGVKFEGEQQSARSFYTKTPKIIQWVIKYSGGLIKDEKQASYAILGFVALAIIISLFLIFGTSEEAKFEAPPGQKIIYPENEPPRLQERF